VIVEKRKLSMTNIAKESGSSAKQTCRSFAKGIENDKIKEKNNDKETPPIQPTAVRVEISRATDLKAERMMFLEKRVAVLKNLVSVGVRVQENEAKIIQCYEQMDKLLEEMTSSDITSSVNSVGGLQFYTPNYSFENRN
jgi:hypothetical protein